MPAKAGEVTLPAQEWRTPLLRSHCDVADQWSFVEMTQLATCGHVTSQTRRRTSCGHGSVSIARNEVGDCVVFLYDEPELNRRHSSHGDRRSQPDEFELQIADGRCFTAPDSSLGPCIRRLISTSANNRHRRAGALLSQRERQIHPDFSSGETVAGNTSASGWGEACQHWDESAQ